MDRKLEQRATGKTLWQSRYNEKAHHLHDQKRRKWAAAQRRPCLCFSTSTALFIANSSPRAGPSTERFTTKFRGIWEQQVKVTRSVERKELDLPRRQCTLSTSTPCSWVSRQPQHVIASASTLLARFSSSRLLPFPKDEDAAESSPFSHSFWYQARIADYHTRDHKSTNITIPNVNTAMSLGTPPYQDWRSL
jgi:hypothetical protein